MSSRSLMHRVFPPSKPPDGGYPPSFRLIVGGTQLRGSWYLSAIVRLQGFSSADPAAPPRRRSPEMVTSGLMVGESEPGCMMKILEAERWLRGTNSHGVAFLQRGGGKTAGTPHPGAWKMERHDA